MIESLVIIVSAATGSGDCWRIIVSQVPVIISLLFAELFTTPTPHCTLDHPSVRVILSGILTLEWI